MFAKNRILQVTTKMVGCAAIINRSYCHST